jgi:hypothetical protein
VRNGTRLCDARRWRRSSWDRRGGQRGGSAARGTGTGAGTYVMRWVPPMLACTAMHGDSALCYVMLCYVMLCYVMLALWAQHRHVMLCYVMLASGLPAQACYVMLCYVMLCYVGVGAPSTGSGRGVQWAWDAHSRMSTRRAASKPLVPSRMSPSHPSASIDLQCAQCHAVSGQWAQGTPCRGEGGRSVACG